MTVEGGLHLCHSASFRDACTQLAAPVISTGAGQPPIGKPLIGQAGGQLRLTWRLYAESPQSGEISLRNGTSCIVAGDFSTQSINRTQTICRQNRHAAPLEMTVEWAACPKSDRLRSDCLTSNFYLLSSIFYLRPPLLSFRPERSEVEKSHSEMVQAS